MNILLVPSSRLQKACQQLKQWQSHLRGSWQQCFLYRSSSTLSLQYSVLFYFALLVLHCNWLEDHHGVLNKTFLICDLFKNFFKGTVILKSVEHVEHTDSLQRTQVTMYMDILYIITFGFDIQQSKVSRRDGECFFLQKRTFGTVFQFKVTMVENFNESVRCLSAVW